jgi:hypothetical protein
MTVEEKGLEPTKVEGGKNKKRELGRGIKVQQPCKSPAVTEPEMSRCPPLRAVSIHAAVSQ